MLQHLISQDLFHKDCQSVALAPRFLVDDYPLHDHDFYEIVIIFSGSGTHYTPRCETMIGKGDVLLIADRDRHGYRDIDDLKLMNILFQPWNIAAPGFRSYFYNCFNPFKCSDTLSAGRWFSLGDEDLKIVQTLLKRLQEEMRRHDLNGDPLVSLAFFQIFLFLFHSCQKQCIPLPERLLGSVNFNGSVKELCSMMNMSASSLYRYFKRETGMSPKEYILDRKIRQAQELLTSSRAPVTEIASCCGFDDSNYFSRMFRKMTGLTPRQWRCFGE